MKTRDILASVLSDAGRDLPVDTNLSTRLKEDLGLDSLELAVLAVHVEAKFGVDVFAKRICQTVGDIESQLSDV